MILNNSKGGNFIALHNGKKVGTVTAVNYQNRFSWIGMVLVDPDIRRCGIGSRLLNAAIESAENMGSVRLDATHQGQKLYKTLGYKDEYNLMQMQLFRNQVNIKIPDESAARLICHLNYF